MVFWLIIQDSAVFQIFSVKMDHTNYALVNNVVVNEPFSMVG